MELGEEFPMEELDSTSEMSLFPEIVDQECCKMKCDNVSIGRRRE
jgi:hypothetical protein